MINKKLKIADNVTFYFLQIRDWKNAKIMKFFALEMSHS